VTGYPTGFMLILIVFAVCLASPAQAAEPLGPRLTFVEGAVEYKQTFRSPGVAAVVDMVIHPGSKITTGNNSRIEITLQDESVVRIGPNSVYRTKLASFSGSKRNRFAAELDRGRLWVRARSSSFSNHNSFRITTPSAVLGIRGTTYDLKANEDKSAEVSVFEGSVAVGPPPIEEGAAHEEIAWPEEVSESVWEEIILGQLQRLRIESDGEPGQTTSFSPDDEKDPWIDWNRLRDQQK